MTERFLLRTQSLPGAISSTDRRPVPRPRKEDQMGETAARLLPWPGGRVSSSRTSRAALLRFSESPQPLASVRSLLLFGPKQILRPDNGSFPGDPLGTFPSLGKHRPPAGAAPAGAGSPVPIPFMPRRAIHDAKHQFMCAVQFMTPTASIHPPERAASVYSELEKDR